MVAITNWADVLTSAFQGIFYGFITFIPNLIIALIIFAVGWIIASILGGFISKLVSSARIDQTLRSAGVERLITRSGFKLDAGGFLGGLVKWFLIVVFLVASLDVLHLTAVTEFLKTVVLGYLPQVIIAVLILLVAAVLADVVQKAVTGAARAANVRSANFVGVIARYAIWIFAILAAMGHLQIANELIQPLFTGFVVALALAFGLSFGLGGQATAARILEKMTNEMK
jgi:Conserved TM helix